MKVSLNGRHKYFQVSSRDTAGHVPLNFDGAEERDPDRADLRQYVI
jgi:hypothetical protein